MQTYGNKPCSMWFSFVYKYVTSLYTWRDSTWWSWGRTLVRLSATEHINVVVQRSTYRYRTRNERKASKNRSKQQRRDLSPEPSDPVTVCRPMSPHCCVTLPLLSYRPSAVSIVAAFLIFLALHLVYVTVTNRLWIPHTQVDRGLWGVWDLGYRNECWEYNSRLDTMSIIQRIV